MTSLAEIPPDTAEAAPGPSPAKRDTASGHRDRRAYRETSQSIAARLARAARHASAIALTADIRGQSWRDHAACQQTDPALFDVTRAADFNVERLRAVQRVCGRCPVWSECGEWAKSDRWSGYAAASAYIAGELVLLPIVGDHDTRLDHCSRGIPSDSIDIRSKTGSQTNDRVETPMATKQTKPGTCACGCGEPVTKQFKPGHDMKLRGQLVKAVRAGELTPAKAVTQARRVSDAFAAKVEASVQTAKK